jgi:uncharacterized spore protein YtfJ
MRKPLKRKKKEIDIHEVLKEVSENIEKTADAKTVFGDPIKVGHRTIIPVATISVSTGGGIGGRGGPRLESKPVGYIEIMEEGAKFVSTPDYTNMALRGIVNGMIAAGMFGLAAVIRAFRKRE